MNAFPIVPSIIVTLLLCVCIKCSTTLLSGDFVFKSMTSKVGIRKLIFVIAGTVLSPLIALAMLYFIYVVYSNSCYDNIKDVLAAIDLIAPSITALIVFIAMLSVATYYVIEQIYTSVKLLPSIKDSNEEVLSKYFIKEWIKKHDVYSLYKGIFKSTRYKIYSLKGKSIVLSKWILKEYPCINQDLQMKLISNICSNFRSLDCFDNIDNWKCCDSSDLKYWLSDEYISGLIDISHIINTGE